MFFTSPRVRGEHRPPSAAVLGKERRSEASATSRSDPGGGTLNEFSLSREPLPPTLSPRRCSDRGEGGQKSGERELKLYLFRPSIGVIASFKRSMPSMQATFSATTSVPSGFLPRANTSTPQSLQD